MTLARGNARGYKFVVRGVPAAQRNHPCLRAACLSQQNRANRNERSR